MTPLTNFTGLPRGRGDEKLSLSRLLMKYLDRSESYLQKKGIELPSLPEWGANNDPLEAWNANDFELIAVMYREHVENLLGFLFQNGALIPSRSKPSELVSEPKLSGIEGIRSSTPAEQQIE
ncbi:hypothetical protein BU17DRAFT_100326 [Hysterangium stoloniferum]|nr:hypothetical protein BU17DRAFT_100326 [Hysterangium stoloniferum]